MRPLPLIAIALAAGLAACGDTEPDPPEAAAGCRIAERGRLTLVAEDNRWDTDCLEAPAGALTIEVDNRDDLAHNVHLADAPGSPATDLEPGPLTQALDVTLEAGTYEFVCDLHINMVGTLAIGEPSAP